jgi:hypothetical protein
MCKKSEVRESDREPYQAEQDDGWVTNRFLPKPKTIRAEAIVYSAVDPETLLTRGGVFTPSWDSTDHMHFICDACGTVADILLVRYNPHYSKSAGARFALFFALGCPKCGETGQRKVYLARRPDAACFQETLIAGEILLFGDGREPYGKVRISGLEAAEERYDKDAQPVKIANMIMTVTRPSDPIEAIMSLFVSRDDAYAVQGSREEIEAGRAYCKVDGLITRALIQDHLDGKTTIGTYFINPKTQTTRTIAWDLDVEVKEPLQGDEWKKIVRDLKPQADKILDVIKKHDLDLAATLIEFSGAKGLHIWLFFDPPIPSILAYALGRKIAEQAGVKAEVFPKQKELLKSYGNLMKLPAGIHRATGLRSVIYDNEWNIVDVTYLTQIEPEFIASDDKKVQELKARLEAQYRPWMEVEAGRDEAYTGEDPPCVVGYLSGRPIPIGARHEVFRRIGCYLLKFKGLSQTEEGWKQVRHILEEWNKHNTPPYDAARFDQEWQKLTEGYDYNYGCRDEFWSKTCDQTCCTMKQAQLARLPGEVSVEAIEKAKSFRSNPAAFIAHVQRCLEYRLTGEMRNRLFMFHTGVSASVQTTLVRIYGPNAVGKKMLYYWMTEFFGIDNVIVLSSSTAAWLKRKVLKGLDTRGKIVILIEERGDVEKGTKYTFEQIYSEDKIKIGFNIRAEGGDWEPIEVVLQGPLTFITTSTELEESFHALTREWEVNPDETDAQSRRINDWDDWRELRSIAELEMEKREIEVIQAYIKQLKTFDRYVIPFTKELNFVYRTLGDRRKKPDLKGLIRSATFLFQDLCPKDEANRIIFAAPFTFDIVMAAAQEIIGVSRGALNRGEKRLLESIEQHSNEILSVMKDGKEPEQDLMRDGKLIREGRPAVAFKLIDIQSHFEGFTDDAIRNWLYGLTRKKRLIQTVSGKGKTGVWMQPPKNIISEVEKAETGLVPSLQPISPEILNLRTSKISEGGKPSAGVYPAWRAPGPLENSEVWNFRIGQESLVSTPERPEITLSTSEMDIVGGSRIETPARPEPLEPFAKYIRQEKKEGSA